MKTRLLTALALGMGAAAFAEPTMEAPAPGSVEPRSFTYTPQQGMAILEVLIPNAIGNRSADFFGMQLTARAEDGKTYESRCEGMSETRDGVKREVCAHFMCKMPQPPSGGLVYSGSIRRNTGDAIVASVPVHVAVDTRQMLKLQAALPAGSGLLEPELEYYSNGLSDEHPIETKVVYTLTPQDKDVRFTTIPSEFIPMQSADGTQPSDLIVDCRRSFRSGNGLSLEIQAHFPDAAERDISCSGSIPLETARFAEPRTVPLEADGVPHELCVSDATFSYTLTRMDADTWYIEYTYAKPDGDEGELFDFGDFTPFTLSTHTYTDPEDGREITSVDAQLDCTADDEAEAAAPVLRIHPFTGRKTITLPITVSGHIHPPFPQTGKSRPGN